MFHINKLQRLSRSINLVKIARQFHDEFTNAIPKITNEKLQNPQNVPTAVASKYQIFKDEDSTIILDIEEERQKINEQIEIEESQPDIYHGLNLNRGIHGVFDIKDLVQVLQKDNAKDIFVCRVAKELKYVDYICVVTGRSERHRKAIVQFVRKMFKLKRNPGEIIPKIEGENSKDWIAIDLGTICC